MRSSLSSAEAPLGYPYKNINNQKNRKSMGGRWEEGKGRSSLFLSPRPPHNTKRPLRRRERGHPSHAEL